MKRGRKKIETPKNKGFRLRLTKDEFDLLTKLASENNVTKSDYIRTKIFIEG